MLINCRIPCWKNTNHLFRGSH